MNEFTFSQLIRLKNAEIKALELKNAEAKALELKNTKKIFRIKK